MLYETNDNENLKLQCTNYITEIKNYKELEMKKRDTLLICLNKISDFIDKLQDVKDSDKLFSVLENIKKALDASSDNIKLLDVLQKEIKEILTQINLEKTVEIQKFNNIYDENNSKIKSNDLNVEDFFGYYIEFCNFNVSDAMTETVKTENIIDKIEELEPTKDEEEIKDNNSLIISEKKGKVILPYTVEELKFTLERNKDKYNNYKDIIETKYTVPLSRYKNAVIARFREAFNLMKYKENASLVKCLDLALELAWNNLLNPAVITACKNLDQLDIYLDYLSTNEIEKFNIFDVKYEIAPMKKI